ncbi:hypothetical protein AGR4C_Lc120050 [Agrobacterium tumefaciens str. Kerr 14]|uniref:Uncharacterized protein n=1 Tax=Agrobacterium tumefaciens str. Kerr 14 TaxID=1183424 RepID=A0A1S7R6M7_AGRTU|nr:hypothetical protein AGR4C_Lc120050 [Agrobacterium tumefaciens str. Kerr 14]
MVILIEFYISSYGIRYLYSGIGALNFGYESKTARRLY